MVCGDSDMKAHPQFTLPAGGSRRRWKRDERRMDCERACAEQTIFCSFYYVSDSNEDCKMFATCNNRVFADGGKLYGNKDLPTTTTTTSTNDGSRRRGVPSDRVRSFILHAPRATREAICSDKLPGHAECIVTNQDLGGILPFITVAATDAEFEAIKASHADIEFGEADAAIHDGPERDVTSLRELPEGVPWGLDRIDSKGTQADLDGWYTPGGSEGRGAHVYVVDTGLLDHQEFRYRMVPTLDVVGVEGVPRECGINGLEDAGLHGYECTQDMGGHGTHIAGTIGGSSSGVARKSTLHAVRVVKSSGAGRSSWLLSALYWIAAHGERPAVVSLNVKSGWKQMDSYKRAIDVLIAAGVSVVLPAGDEAKDACDNFLQTNKSITVGASGKTVVNNHYFADFFADFSNSGKCVDILAPGIDIVTADPWNKKQFAKVTGTSMAGAHAAGAVALLLGTGDVSSPADVRAAILDGAAGMNRRRREPDIAHRRRSSLDGAKKHRPIGDTSDRMLHVQITTKSIHRRREPANLRRRRTPPPPPPGPEPPAPTKTISKNQVPVYGPSQANGQWIVNFALPPEGFEYFASSYSETLAADFCRDLPGAAGCVFKGRPRRGGIPFVMLTASEAELEGILDRYNDTIANTFPKVDFVEADTKVIAMPEIAVSAEPDTPMGPLPAVGRRRRGVSWGLDRIDSLYTLDGAYMVPKTGGSRFFAADLNVTTEIYVLDTGVRTTHKDFQGRATPAIDLTSGCVRECKGDTSCASDTNGHGTHVAAVAAGGEYGVAKAAKLHAVKVLDDSGEGWLSWTIAALDYIGRKGSAPAVAVFNAEGAGISRSMQRAVDMANLLGGITIVVGAGNSGGDACANHPANMKTNGGDRGAGTIVFAATVQEDRLADYSNYGTCIDYLAPGSAILTASHVDDEGSVLASGTSLASAHGAGAAALLLASERAVNPARVDIHLYLDSYNEAQIDLQNEHAATKNRLINVREATIAPTVEPEAKTCYDCQYTRSGCPCMKEWTYQFDGKQHTCTDYCCNPYGSEIGSWCMTQTMCTVRVKGREPERRESDYCDTVPGRRLTGGWLDKPYVYEDTSIPMQPQEPEENCSGVTPALSTSLSPATDTPKPTLVPPNGHTTTQSATSTSTDRQGSTNVASTFEGTPQPETIVANVEADLDCLKKRLAGKPCP
eukprot:TRINITY_DN1478_c0_g1_i3.p1 TRINITY_DN1478_c0_g1~~TRINITY_DN1478_c0_g1_i3.p1  ORF type:complete len:1252 (-),score=187.08 TRINITY_DN1478_c0_g1_i3:54-3587(-)